ncbi:MAG TPA: hypothetical protein PLE45_02415 [Spirochaetota bacterium]|nr:hypothetical protein [Spirochaetota bacterium]HOL55952.1 hypothetical protein [Spirochaetota bacterium]
MYIIVNPIGGLGNRMRVISSALSYARELNKKVIILWFKTKDLNCSYNKLFKKNKNFKVISINEPNSKIPFLNKIISTISKVIINNFLKKSYYFEDNIQESIKQLISGNRSIRKNIFIKTCHQFHPVNDYSIFIPIDKIQKKIKNIVKRFNDYTIGIHIRRTDNEISKLHTSTEKIIQLLDDEIKLDPGVKFFLATDSLEEEKYLLQKYSDRIIIQENKTLSRDSQKGIEDALVDLYCLSKTKKVYGSYWSSFTDTTAKLNPKLELIIVK